jgi:transposase-like zinc-binding protein
LGAEKYFSITVFSLRDLPAMAEPPYQETPPNLMVRRRGSNYIQTPAKSFLHGLHSPLRKTHHKACNGELSITCRNRHCPKCQSGGSAAWLDQRAAELLPVEYFHVVFTLPQSLAPLALQNQRVVYGILFKAASETLLQIGADPKHLGALIGFLAVLHTWGQNLHQNPHS